jgi:hypothetical protein
MPENHTALVPFTVQPLADGSPSPCCGWNHRRRRGFTGLELRIQGRKKQHVIEMEAVFSGSRFEERRKEEGCF